MNTDLKETIAELQRIDELVTRFCDIGDELDALKVRHESEARSIYYEYRPKLPGGMPAFKTLQPEMGAFESLYARSVKISGIAFLAALLFWLIAKLASWYGMGVYAVLAMIGFAIWFVVAYRNLAADKKEYDGLVKRRKDFVAILQESHTQDTADFQAELSDYCVKFRLFEHKFKQCCDEYVDEHNALVQESDQIEQALGQVTLLAQEHLGLAGRIGSLLKSKRADTLKEALNLAIAEKRDEDFKEKQLAEEARRTRIAEQQAYDNRMHNQQMAQQAQLQSELAKAQLKATQQQNEKINQLINGKK